LRKSQLRFSLLAVFIGLTVVCLSCAFFMLSDIGYEFDYPVTGMSDADEQGMMQEGYGIDPLNLRKGKLKYLFVGIAPKGASISMESYYPSRRTGRLTKFVIDGEAIELPNDVQLVQVDHGELKTFNERITLKQWRDFKNSRKGIFRIEDLLDFCDRSQKLRD
jgi:hypothetical protein